MKRPSRGTRHGLLLFSYFFAPEKRETFCEICSFWTAEREKATFIIFFFFLSLWSLTGLMAANRLLAQSTQIHKQQMEVQENPRIPIYNDGKKKTTVTWKEKVVKTVCEMSKYLTVIPLLREMCFPAIIPGWWREKKNNCGKWTFLRLSLLGKWAHVIWSWNNPLLHFYFYYYIYPAGFLLLILFLKSMVEDVSIHPLITGFMSVLMAEDKMADHFCWPPADISHSCRICLYFFPFFHSRHTPPSIFLFFLNVIVSVPVRWL